MGDIILKTTDGAPIIRLSGGLTGPIGPQGIQGEQGDPGPQGIQGVQGIQGEAGVGTYTNLTAVPSDIGGIEAGDTFSAVPMVTMLDRLLYPYQTPVFTSFYMSGQSQTVEVGTQVSGSKTFIWASSNDSNVGAGSVTITGPNALSSSGNTPDGSIALNVGTNQLTSPGSLTWSIDGTDTHSDHYGATFGVTWLWKKFTGTSASTTLDETGIELLTGALASDSNGNYSLAAGDYKYFAFPSSFSAVSSFTDTSTGFDVAMADSTDNAAYSGTANGLSFATVSVTNALGITTNYRVYRTKYTLGGTITIGVA